MKSKSLVYFIDPFYNDLPGRVLREILKRYMFRLKKIYFSDLKKAFPEVPESALLKAIKFLEENKQIEVTKWYGKNELCISPHPQTYHYEWFLKSYAERSPIVKIIEEESENERNST